MNWTALCNATSAFFKRAAITYTTPNVVQPRVHTIFIAKIAICSPNFIQIGRDCKTVLNDAFEFSVKKFKNKISFCKYE